MQTHNKNDTGWKICNISMYIQINPDNFGKFFFSISKKKNVRKMCKKKNIRENVRKKICKKKNDEKKKYIYIIKNVKEKKKWQHAKKKKITKK